MVSRYSTSILIYIFLRIDLRNEVLRQLHLHTLLAYQWIAVDGFRNSVNFDLQLIFHKRQYSLTGPRNLSLLPWPWRPVSGPCISPKNAVHPLVPCFSRSVLLLDKCPSHYIIFTRNSTDSFKGSCFILKTFQALISYIGVLPSVVRSMYNFFSLKSYLT